MKKLGTRASTPESTAIIASAAADARRVRGAEGAAVAHYTTTFDANFVSISHCFVIGHISIAQQNILWRHRQRSLQSSEFRISGVGFRGGFRVEGS